MIFDFSHEEEQQATPQGPVPAGSIVIVQLNLVQPAEAYAAPEDFMISRTRNGMRQIYCQFLVREGSYSGSQWRESITLPRGMQKEQLTAGQEKSAQIGGAILKAILQAAGKPLRISNVYDFNGLTFPVQVKINDRPAEKDGRVYWNNAIYKVITPDMQEYDEIKTKREIINRDGAVEGKAPAMAKKTAFDVAAAPEATSMDDYVF